jgi:hypothetical protein
MAIWTKPTANGGQVEARNVSSFQAIINHINEAHRQFEGALNHLSLLTHDLTKASTWATRFAESLTKAIEDNGGTLEQDVEQAIRDYAPKAIREAAAETPQT